MKLFGTLLLILGILGIMSGGCSYTTEKGDAKIGPIEVQVTERERVNIPLWAGIGAIVVGGILLLRKR